MGKKSGYHGPSALELANQRDAYRKTWDAEAKQKELEALGKEKAEETRQARNELQNRKGMRQLLADNQRGFTSDTPSKDQNSLIDFTGEL